MELKYKQKNLVILSDHIKLKKEIIMNNEVKKENKFKKFLKRHKVALIVSGVVITALFPILFVSFRFIHIYNTGFIDDINGPDDFSVATITDEEIQNTVRGSYTSFVSGKNTDGKQSDIKDKWLEDIDYDQTSYQSQSISGIYIANATKTNSDNMKLTITSTVESGNTEIFVFIDDELYSEVNINSRETLSLSGISGKTVYVKAACENANMTIQVERNIGGESE